jgi:ribose transport system substrate-binding protein
VTTTKRRMVAPLGLAVAAGLALSACGGGSGSNAAGSSNGNGGSTAAAVSKAQANLDKYLNPRVPAPAGSPFDASGASGKLVELVTQKGANPAVASVAASITTALEHEGVTVRSCDAQGVSVNISTCINQGLSQRADAVIVDGGDPEAYSAGLQAAKQAKVPLVSALDVPLASEISDSGVSPSGVEGRLAGLSSNAAPPDALSGTLLADYIIAESKGHATGLLITSPGIVGSDYLEKAFSVEMKKLCSACDFTTKGVVITNWAQDLSPVVSSYLAQHPNANYIVPVFDPMAAYTDPAIRSAGKADSVKGVTANGSLQQMQELATGGLLAAEAGQDLPELGFIAADQTLRLLVGQPVAKGAAAQVRMFTSSNIGTIKVTADASRTGEWFTGDSSALSSLYYKLWSNQS